MKKACQPCPDKIPCLLIYRECNFGEQPTGCCPCQTKNINLKL
ncbi:hypothetical protein DDB_G0267806 [Dictyostelium discoideum AX4]|uniref:Uncharacterized protein n=1 Tax=Dictyostelium discoideum TaxID=44689 RepID=Q55G57_DICDI|nr:hypothetical protein DDB_G0267806 [Dictyostelium discoideum AX4]EAL73356.1 hypothetical protein DDB_G0267806 [Dictyostelium discoideum AX4]|eukprot:XP_647326.1 hypothetical protein DDB_G0267806 [Dictyostelium discoideum AX4]